MLQIRIAGVLSFFMLSWCVAAGVDAPRGIGLVIGNGAYPERPLINPPNDAQAIASQLTQLGYKVDLIQDSSLKEMTKAIESLLKSLPNTDVPFVFFYAGHAVQLNGINYLIPVDARVSQASDIPQQSIAVDAILDAVRNGLRKAPNILVLDACRSNPFSTVSALEWIPGLAPPTNAPANTLVAYATDPGRLAPDGVGLPHSPYTSALLRYLGWPGLSIEDLFKKVRSDVRLMTQDQQTPWENTSITGAFYFRTPVYLHARIVGADDDALLVLNGQEVLDWNQDGGSAKQIVLGTGDNELVIKVYNQRSYTGGVQGFGGHLPEGWNYTAELLAGDGTPLKLAQGGTVPILYAIEDHPADNGPHHGKLFDVARMLLVVDPSSGDLTVRNFDPNVWQHSLQFSLAAVADCAGDVPKHLDWCSTDNGYNEGAECGLRALAGTGVNLPADVGQQVLGNIWDRTNMMGATKAAWKAGAKDAAVKAAVCCQIHNPPAHSCVESKPDLVKQWLAAH